MFYASSLPQMCQFLLHTFTANICKFSSLSKTRWTQKLKRMVFRTIFNSIYIMVPRKIWQISQSIERRVATIVSFFVSFVSRLHSLQSFNLHLLFRYVEKSPNSGFLRQLRVAYELPHIFIFTLPYLCIQRICHPCFSFELAHISCSSKQTKERNGQIFS